MARPETVPTDPFSTPSALDALVEDLRRLRVDAGELPYGEIATRIAERRQDNGVEPRAARIARSTVFDAFQTGRRRMNPELVKEIVLALGHDEDEAERWRQRYLDARSGVAPAEPAPPSPVAGAIANQRVKLMLGVLVACVALNHYLNTIIVHHEILLYLDMIGTATAAFVFGPWYGAVVGIASNTFGALTTSPETIVFALVNVAGAVVWGYGIRRYANSLPRLLILSIVAGIVCTLVAAPLNVLLYDGASLHASTAYIERAREFESVWMATFSVNAVVSIVDKVIAGLLGLWFARLLVRAHFGVDPSAELPQLLKERTSPGRFSRLRPRRRTAPE